MLHPSQMVFIVTELTQSVLNFSWGVMGRQENYEDMDQPLFIREHPSQVMKEQFHTARLTWQHRL